MLDSYYKVIWYYFDTYRHNTISPWVNYPQLLVFGCCDKQRSIKLPADALKLVFGNLNGYKRTQKKKKNDMNFSMKTLFMCMHGSKWIRSDFVSATVCVRESVCVCVCVCVCVRLPSNRGHNHGIPYLDWGVVSRHFTTQMKQLSPRGCYSEMQDKKLTWINWLISIHPKYSKFNKMVLFLFLLITLFHLANCIRITNMYILWHNCEQKIGRSFAELLK